MNRKILSVLIVLIFALSMSTVVAADANNADISIDNSSNALEISKSFGDLQDKIDNTNPNETCILDDDYMYYPLIDMKYKDGVVITQNITINGDGHTINALNLARIFNIENNGNDTVTVTLCNLTLKNAKINDNGGAILINGNNSAFINCENVIFNNCKADMGGAIFAYENAYLNITNCIFTENEAESMGGAIYSLNKNDTTCPVIIEKSVFISNNAPEASIIYCNNISAQYSIFDSEINNDTAFIVIDNEDVNVTLNKNYWGTNNATFYGSELSDDYYFHAYLVKLVNSQFPVNATSWYILTLSKNIMANVTEEGYRGNVSAKFELTNGTDILSDSEVLPDYTITVKTEIEEFKTTVQNNIVDIEFEIPGVEFDVVIINNNGVNITKQNYTVPVPYNSFTALANNLTYGVLVFDCDYKYYTYFDSAYKNGLVLNNPITINGNGFSISGSDLARIFYVNSADVVIANLTLKNGNALTGAAIYATENIGDSSLSGLFNNHFIDNKALKGAAIYTEKSITLINNYFTNNVAFSLLDNTYGGAIYAIGNVTVFKGSFIRNSAMYGAAIYAQGDISATSSIFDGNVGSHGSIYSMSTVSNVDFCFWGQNFEANQDFIDAGLIFADDVAQAPHKWVLLNFTTPLFETPQFFRTYTISLIDVNDGSKLKIWDLLPDYTVNLVGLGVFNDTLIIGKRVIPVSPVVSQVTISKGDGEFQFALFGNSFITVKNNVLTTIVSNDIGTKPYTFTEYQKIINGDGEMIDYVPVVNITINQTSIKAHILLEDVVYNPIKDRTLNRTGLVINNTIHLVGFGHEIDANGLARAFTITENGNLTLAMVHIENTTSMAIVNNGELRSFVSKIEGNILNNGTFTAHLNVIDGNIINNDELSVHANIMKGHFIVNNGYITSISRVNIIDKTGSFGQAGNFTAYLSDDVGNLIIPNNDTDVVLTDQYGALYEGVKDGYYFVFNYPGTLDVQTYHFISEVNDIEKTIALGTLSIAPKDSFSALNNLIADTPVNGVLNLTRDYKYYDEFDSDLEEGIIISKNITINGNDYTIDAKNDARIFKVTADYARFDNINFVNGYALVEGAAIYTENSYIFIGENNTFVNNNAISGRGGAIYNKAGNTVVSINNQFIDNEGTWGGAIYSRSGNIFVGIMNFFVNNTATSGNGGALCTVDGDINVYMINYFVGNVALAGLEISHGGAIDSYNGTILINEFNHFVNNVAERGGAIASGKELTVNDNNIFGSNIAVTFGGAIYAHGINVGNNIFNDNFAANGGAIAIMDSETNDINLIKGVFVNNSAVNGGAIYTQSINNVEDMVFINNTAFNGGAIFVNEGGSLTVKNSTFIGNGATMNGGAIHSHGDVKIVDNNTFKNNAAMNGGAIYLHDENSLIINNENTFLNNSAVINGGAINAHKIFIDNNNVFVLNSALNGGAIDTENLIMNSTNVFYANVASLNGGAINADGRVFILGTEFAGNSAFNGGALYLSDSRATIEGSKFVANQGVLGSDIYANDEILSLRFNEMTGTIYLRNSNITTPVVLNIVSGVDENGTYSLNATLTANGAKVIIPGGFNLVDNEGHIYLCNLLTSQDGVYNFIIPTVLLHSGEYTFENTEIDGINDLIINGSLTIIPPEDSFTALYEKIKNSNGTVELDKYYKYYPILDSHLKNGIPIENDLTINGNLFTIDGQDLARIFNVSADTFVLNNVGLINGHALTEGAAIYTENSTIVVNNILFRNNNALFGRGGAIYNIKGKTIINNSLFDNNNGLYGGAIYSRLGSIIVLDKNTFTNNSATNGGALATIEGNIFIGSNNTFIENDAINGGSIFTELGKITILSDNEFRNNTAIDGGVIYTENDLHVDSHNLFANNIADNLGGAIYVENGNVTLANDLFILNEAYYGGSLYIINATIDIEKCFFINNSASYAGNMDIKNTLCNINNSYFNNNYASLGHENCFIESQVMISNSVFNNDEGVYSPGIDFENSVVSLYDNIFNTTIDDENSIFKTPVQLEISSIYDEIIGEYKLYACLKVDGAYIITEPFDLVDDEGNNYTYNPLRSYDFAYGFNVPDDLETGVYTFENAEIEGFEELEVSGNLTIDSHYELDAHNLIKYYGSADKLEAVVTDNGHAVAGVNVTFTINGRSYVRTTDENGVARLNINLNAGTYEANVTFGNITETVFVYVKSTIDIDDFTKTYGQYGAFEAYFCDQFGHDLVYKDIQYNINGVFYTHTTNADGEDHLNINLLPGEYIITVYNLFTGEVASATVTVLEPTNEIVA